jgi:hypothetical protein
MADAPWRHTRNMADEMSRPPQLGVSRPLRGVADLELLIDYVLGTSPNNETNWLEWKRGLDLSTPAGRFEVSRHILGFGNRHPDRAGINMGGCAYLVLGAEPGNLVGQPSIDPADLQAGLQAYVSHDGPQWSPVWIPRNGLDVLVITVEPPQWGDRIHTLEKGFDGSQAGEIFVRRVGSTNPRSPAEMAMLQERLLRQPSNPVQVDVQSIGPALLALDLCGSAKNEWGEAERSRLLVPLADAERQAAPKAAATHPSVAAALNIDKALAPLHPTARTWGSMIDPETRTPDQYRQEVDAYLDECQQALPGAAAAAFARAQLAWLRLTLVNPTDTNVPSVKLDVAFDGPVFTFDFDPDDELPRPPRMWGPQANRFFGPSVDLALPNFGAIAPVAPLGFRTRNPGSTEVDYDPVDLRPRATVKLPKVPILVSSEAGSTITGAWRATSKGFDGVVEDTVTIPVAGAITPLELLPSHEG